MKYKKFFKFMVLILGILIANLLTIWIDNYMLTYKWKYSPHIFAWIGMAVVVGIYYPLFTKIDKWASGLSERFMKVGKKLVGKEIGTVVAFLIALIILYVLYGYEWFDRNVLVTFFESLRN